MTGPQAGTVPPEAVHSAITAELAGPDIAGAMAEIGATPAELTAAVEGRTSDLAAATSVESHRLDDLLQRLAIVTDEVHPRGWTARRGRQFALVPGLTAAAVSVVLLLRGTQLAGWVLTAISVVSLLPSAYLAARKFRGQESSGVEYAVLQRHLETATLDRDSALRRAVAGLLREEINRRLPSYALELAIAEPRGLAELADPQYLITVPAAGEIDQLLATMPGGSIGVSGPRGIGKTTLLRHFCSREHAPPEETPPGESPPLRVLLPAPVKYDAREFILLLFSKVCSAVAPDGLDRTAPPERWVDAQQRRLVELLALTIGTFAFAWGAFLLAASLAGWQLPPNLFPAVSLILVSLPVSLVAATYRLRRRVRVLDEFHWITEQFGPEAAEAHALLRGLAYQQSVSRNWSAGVKTPIGLEGAVASSVTMTDRPWSFPEIVGRLNDFLRTLCKARRVFIGIDELDKIDSGEQVYQFVNDIKGIFGQERCFYLISVSDNAMSSFERRGLPVRDAFDSSLDTVVELHPAGLEMSRTLMRRRVIGMPEAFLCLCHVVSGGLPRDLIRTARELVALSRGKHGADLTLTALTRELVRADLRRKARAVEVAAQEIDFEPEVGAFVCTVHGLLTDPQEPTAERLLQTTTHLTQGLFRPSPTAPDPVRAAHDRLNRLRTETAAYVCFCSTLISVFDGSLVREKVLELTAATDDGSLARLTEVRQNFAVNPRLAWSLLSSFRQRRGLRPTPPYPLP